MDLKFINSEHFFILAACIKECDVEDEYEELEKYDFDHFNEISEKIIDKFKTGKNENFSNEVDHVFFYTYRTMLINVNMNKVQEAQLREIFKRQKRVWKNQEVKKYITDSINREYLMG